MGKQEEGRIGRAAALNIQKSRHIAYTPTAVMIKTTSDDDQCNEASQSQVTMNMIHAREK